MDNGIIILETSNEDGGPEFRVAYLDYVDYIYGDWNDDTGNWDPNHANILDTFTESTVFDSAESAFDFAQELAIDQPYLENGIMLVTDFKDLVFNNI